MAFSAILFVGWGTPAFGQDLAPTNLSVFDGKDYIGRWTLSMTLFGEPWEVWLDLDQLDGKMTGFAMTQFHEIPEPVTEMSLIRDGIRIVFPVTVHDSKQIVFVDANLSGTTMTGTVHTADGHAKAEFSGERGTKNLSAIRARALSDRSEAQSRSRRGRYGPEIRKTVGGNEIFIRYLDLKTDSEDFETFSKLETGEVFRFVGGRATKLMTDADLVFGDTVIRTENADQGYPGVYSLWLKKTEAGWALVFNSDSDIWGSQRLAEADVAEIPLTVSKLDDPQDEFTVEVLETEDGGAIRLAWDTTAWTAPFTLAERTVARSTADAPKD